MKRNILIPLIATTCIFAALWGSGELVCYFLHKKIKSSDYIIKDTFFSLLDSGEYEKDKDILFRLKPNRSFSWGYDVKHQTGEKGWRIGSKDTDDDADVKIIAVGDSCTFGLGIPYGKTYGAVLEKRINEESAHKVKVYNFGIPGFTSFQCRKLVEKVISSLKPTIIICYIGANDAEPVMKYSDKEHYEKINTESFAHRLVKCSNIFKLLEAKQRKKRMTLLKQGIEQLPQDVDWFKLTLPDLMIELEQKGAKIDKNFFNKKRVIVDEFKENLLAMKRVAQGHNATFIYIPNVWNDGKNLRYYEHYLPIDYLDIKREFEKYKTENVLIDTVHPSVKGHSIIAEMLFRLISENKI